MGWPRASLPPAANGYFFVFGGEGPNGVSHVMAMNLPAQHRWYAPEPLLIAVHGVTGATAVREPATKPSSAAATTPASSSSFAFPGRKCKLR